jgi:uncharacterized protein (TIGR00156 family)
MYFERSLISIEEDIMKSKFIVSALLSIGVTLAASSAMAQYTGSSASRGGFQGPGSASDQPMTVANILRTPVDDLRVTLRGNIIRKIGGDKYVFSDGTGEIRVDIDNSEWPAEPVNEKTTVEIIGEVYIGVLVEMAIDVKVLRIIK